MNTRLFALGLISLISWSAPASAQDPLTSQLVETEGLDIGTSTSEIAITSQSPCC